MPRTLKKREIQSRVRFLSLNFPTKGKISIFAFREIKRLAKQADSKTLEWMKKWITNHVSDKKQREKLSKYLEAMKKGGKPRWKRRVKDESLFIEARMGVIYKEIEKHGELSPWAIGVVRDYYRLGKIPKPMVENIIMCIKNEKQKERIKKMLKI